MRKHLLLLCFGWLTLQQLAAGETLLVAQEDADNRPFEYLAEDGSLTGFHTDIVRAVGKQLGWEVKISRLPWKRAQMLLANGDVDAVTFMGKTPERQQYALYLEGNQLAVQRMALYVRMADARRIHYRPPVVTMMKTWRFGAPRGYFLSQELSEALSNGAQVDQTASTPMQLFKMLLAHRIDVAMAGVMSLQMAGEQAPALPAQIQRLGGVVFSSSPVYIAFSLKGDNPKRAYEFATAYAAWRKSKAYRELVTRDQFADRVPDGYLAR